MAISTFEIKICGQIFLPKRMVFTNLVTIISVYYWICSYKCFILLYICVLLCFVVFFEVCLQVLDFPVDNGGNNLPLAEELYCIINILTMCILVMYGNFLVNVHVMSWYTCNEWLGILMYVDMRRGYSCGRGVILWSRIDSWGFLWVVQDHVITRRWSSLLLNRRDTVYWKILLW